MTSIKSRSVNSSEDFSGPGSFGQPPLKVKCLARPDLFGGPMLQEDLCPLHLAVGFVVEPT